MASLSDEVAAIHAALQQGNADDAKRHIQGTLAIAPDSIEVLALAGVIASKLGNVSEAKEHFQRILALHADHPEALIGLMMVLRGEGDHAKSLDFAHRALARDPQNPLVLNTLGLNYYHLGELEEALRNFDQALLINPDVAAIHRHRGLVLIGLQRDTEARQAFETCLKLHPQDASAWIRLASLHLQHDRPKEALRAATKARLIDDRLPEAIYIQARSFDRLGQISDAEGTFLGGIQIEPSLRTAYAIWLVEQGRIEQAHSIFTDLVVAEPENGIALYYAIETSDSPISETAVGRLEQIKQFAEVPESRVYAAYALGKYYEKRKDADASFANYQLANSIMFGEKFRHQNDLVSTITSEVDRSIAVFSANRLAELAVNGSTTQRPIFIVGMIRSGTTLLEQIVSSHSAVHGGGELRYWMENGPVALNHLDNLKSYGWGYEEVIQKLGSGSKRLTDKMPLNLRFLGLIYASFPNARILHIHRDPLDTCFSIYSTPFSDPPLFSYDLTNIGTVYREYDRLMQHWRAVIPTDRLLNIAYEDLVSDQEVQTRRIIDFCGLPWEDACLHPEQNQATVYTPSTLQVRKPVNKSAIARWKPFESHLAPLIEALGPLAKVG